MLRLICHSFLNGQLKQIVETFLRVLLDQVDHALLTVSFTVSSLTAHLRCMTPYRWHDRLPVLADHVTERHLGALMRVRPDLWVVNVRDLLDRNCTTLVAASEMQQGTYFGLGRKFS